MLNDETIVQHFRTACRGEDCIEAYWAIRPDCVLLDDNLPCPSGIEVHRKLKASDRFATIVLTTKQGNEKVAAEAIKMGAADYVVKVQVTNDSPRRSVARLINGIVVPKRLAQRFEEQSLFLSTLIHDAGAPLRQIRKFTDELVADIGAGDYDEAVEQGAAVASAATRLHTPIDTLNAYALLDKRVISR